VAYTSGALGRHEVLDGSIVGTHEGPRPAEHSRRSGSWGRFRFHGRSEMDCIRARASELFEVILEYFPVKKAVQRIILHGAFKPFCPRDYMLDFMYRPFVTCMYMDVVELRILLA
jgi:hypothetical protein